MLDQIQYSVTGQWAAGGSSMVAGENTGKAIEFSAPPEFHGQAGFWTPEHFLLAAVASCFVATFRAMAGYSKFDPVALQVSVEGRLEKGQNGYDFAHILLRPQLTIREESDRPRGIRLLEKAERGCLVARALKCQVTMEAGVNLPQMEAIGT